MQTNNMGNRQKVMAWLRYFTWIPKAIFSKAVGPVDLPKLVNANHALWQPTSGTASHAKEKTIENANPNVTATNWNVNSHALTFQQTSGTANAPRTANHKENRTAPFPRNLYL